MRRQVRRHRPMSFFPRQPDTPSNHLLDLRLIRRIFIERRVRHDHSVIVIQRPQADIEHRVLISHDAGWYSVGEPQGGTYRGYETLFTEFLPALRKAGLTDAEIKLLTVASPAQAFSIGIRTR